MEISNSLKTTEKSDQFDSLDEQSMMQRLQKKLMEEAKDLNSPNSPNLPNSPISFLNTHIINSPEEILSDFPSWDDKACPGLLGKFVKVATRKSEAHPAAVAVTFLVRFGIEVGHQPFYMIGDAKHHARLFTVLVGASSSSRKGTSIHPVNRLFDFKGINIIYNGNLNLNNNYFNNYKSCTVSPGPLSTGEGLVYAVHDPIQEWKIDPKTNQGSYVIKDPGIQDKRLFVLEEEFAAALHCAKREGSTLSSFLRLAWDSGNIAPLTKSNKISTTNAHIGIVNHITLFELMNCLKDVDIFNGFANRFLWIYVNRPRKVSRPEGIPTKELTNLQLELFKIITQAQSLTEIKMSNSAYELWDTIYYNLSDNQPGIIGTILSRASAQLIRLSLIYALLDGKGEIAPEHINSAMALWSYAEQSVKCIFSSKSGNRITDKILSALSQKPHTLTELYSFFQCHINKDSLHASIQELIANGIIEKKEEKTPGSSRTVLSKKEKSS